jgi:flavin reductase (DIM6/NTAB) family NADH-FMN oxidoreductase RutF
MFSSNPPIVIFSPSRRVRDNTTKHTLQNVTEVPEVVINVVTYDMVQQTSLASCEYPKGTDEFIKAGFTKEPAHMVRPPLVKESKAKLECKVIEIKPLGNEAGAGNLVICEVLCLHVADELLTAGKKVDQTKLELVARLGGDWYGRVSEDDLFFVPKPNVRLGIGIDALPEDIRHSSILTGNHLGKLANVEKIPDVASSDEIHFSEKGPQNIHISKAEKHRLAANLLDENKVFEAWQCLLR